MNPLRERDTSDIGGLDQKDRQAKVQVGRTRFPGGNPSFNWDAGCDRQRWRNREERDRSSRYGRVFRKCKRSAGHRTELLP